VTIISNYYNLIFLKPYKTGGTSVLQSLANILPASDSVSAVFLNPEDLNKYKEQRITRLNQTNSKVMPGLNRYQVNTNLNAHATPEEIISEIGVDAWKAYKKFTIVRNPWDMMISFSRTPAINPDAKPDLTVKSFRKFVLNFNPRSLSNTLSGKEINECWYFFENGRKTADHYLRFENLQSNFTELCKLFSINEPPLLHLRKRNPTYKAHELYDAECAEKVNFLYQKTINYFGYSFEDCI
jgi:hypothetical protein